MRIPSAPQPLGLVLFGYAALCAASLFVVLDGTAEAGQAFLFTVLPAGLCGWRLAPWLDRHAATTRRGGLGAFMGLVVTACAALLGAALLVAAWSLDGPDGGRHLVSASSFSDAVGLSLFGAAIVTVPAAPLGMVAGWLFVRLSRSAPSTTEAMPAR